MKIVTLGSSPLMIHGILSGFKKLGYNTDHFPHHSWFKITEEEGVNYIKNHLIETKADFLIFGGYGPKYFTIIPELCKENGVAFIYWAIEDPIGFKKTLFLAEKADYIFTTSIECIPQYFNKGIKAHLLTFACNPEYHYKGNYSNKYNIDIAMTASYYNWKCRKKGFDIILDAAIESNYKLKVWGSGWQSEAGQKRLDNNNIFQGYFPNGKLPELCASAKIVLGVQCDDSSITQTSMRPYEVLACCGFHLTQWTKATTNIFENNKHLVTAHSKEEALEKINYFIDKPDERRKIAQQGQKFVYKYHTYELRVRESILPHL